MAPLNCLNFDDEQIQKHCERVVSVMTTLPEDLRPVCALLDACHWYTLIEGEQSPRVREIIKRLMAPELRTALKDWYSQPGKSNSVADTFRRTLENEIGEKLG